MKKLLLTLAAVVGLGFAATAEEVTFDFTKTTDGKIYGYTAVDANGEYEKSGTITEGPVSFTMTTPSGNGFRFYVSNGAYSLRTYNGSVFTISVPDGAVITKIEFAGNNMNAISYGDPKTVLAAKTATWEGNATSVAFSNTEKKTDNKGKQSNITATLNTIKVTYTPAAGGLEPAGIKYEGTAFSVTLGDNFTEPTLTNPNNLAVTYSSSKEEVATVDASTGEVTIAGVGTTTITATSAETDKYYEGKASYTITVVKTYANPEEFYAVGANNKGLIGFNLIVTYVNGQNCYVQTAKGEATLIYGATSYEVGDVIPAGWEGTYSPFNGLPEIKPVGTMPAATGKETVTYPEVTSVSADDVNKIVVLNGVQFDAATASGSEKVSFTGKVGETPYTFRNNFADVESVPAGLYNVTCAVALYKGAVQLYPTAYVAVETGIDEIEAAENAPVEYFNLQGVRVANPENGLYIRRQGNKVTKVIVK